MKTIASRLWGLVICSVVALVIVGGVGKWVSDVGIGTVARVLGTLPHIDTIAEMRADVMVMRMSINGHLAALQTQDKDRLATAIDAAAKSFAEHARQYAADGFSGAEDEALLKAESDLLPAYLAALKEVMAASSRPMQNCRILSHREC